MQRGSSGKGRRSLQFEKDFFDSRRYTLKEKIVKRHVLEVIKWASKVTEDNLLSGQGKNALDVGCACGYSSKVLETLRYETCAIDLSKWDVKQENSYANGDFLVCDAQTSLPSEPVSFDLIICFDVLEHLKFPQKAILNMLEACQGTLVCTTPNKVVEKPVRKITRDFDETHINVKSPSEWEKIIQGKTDYNLLKVETFLDLAARLTNSRVFFKSLKLPEFGLTVRILVKK
jgi:SAM-dependent methyltransferase